MARRKKAANDLTGLIVQLVGVAMLICLVYPPFRQIITSIGLVFLLILAVAFVAVLGFLIYKRTWGHGAQPGNPSFETRASFPSVSRSMPTTSPLAPQQAAKTLPAPVEKSLTARELTDQMRGIDWFQFEQLIDLIYRKRGYVVSRRGGANPDGGIDLVIEQEGAKTAVQCKHWKTRDVGVKAVREFLGALTDLDQAKGLMLTLGGYTAEAKRLADKHGIEILNETDLAEMLEATDSRFDPAVLEILHDKRKLCPKCEQEMVVRTAGKGPGAGKQFWGCSGYPRCRFTMRFTNND